MYSVYSLLLSYAKIGCQRYQHPMISMCTFLLCQ